jgi:hypothetical protein
LVRRQRCLCELHGLMIDGSNYGRANRWLPNKIYLQT